MFGNNKRRCCQLANWVCELSNPKISLPKSARGRSCYFRGRPSDSGKGDKRSAIADIARVFLVNLDYGHSKNPIL